MLYDTHNYRIHGVYKPSYNWGGPTLIEPGPSKSEIGHRGFQRSPSGKP